MATIASVFTRISLAALLLAPGAALAQSQGDTGIGGALDQAQAGIADVEDTLDEFWNGQAGKWVQGGIGVLGAAAALLSAGDAVYSKSGEGTLTFGKDSSPRLSLGTGTTETTSGTTATTSATTGTR